MMDSSHCKKCLSNVVMKSLPVQLGSVDPCLLHVAPYEERASVLSVAAL